MSNRKPERTAFTLVELLVVIAIIGVLVAMLLPAVQAAREAARRSSCTNNMKQIGISLHNYHDTYKVFPSGAIVPFTTANYEVWGWSALMLPFMEQQPLHDKLGVTKGNIYENLQGTNAAQVRAALETVLEPFMCPSDTGFQAPGRVHNDRNFSGGVGYAAAGAYVPGVSNYMGNSGHRNNPINFNTSSGIFYANSFIGFRDVNDGTSSTIAVGERETRFGRSGTWVGIRNNNGAGTRGVWTAYCQSRPKINQPDPPVPWGNDDGVGEGISSLHPGGANVLLCDGSVRFIPETINHFWFGNAVADHRDPSNGVFQRLMSRDDSLPVSGY